jgi:transcriptional regulator with XRE-family HTH domain
MGQAEGAQRPLPPQFWTAPAVVAALSCCDLAVLLEEVRRARGWTQRQLAQEAGYSQSWVSNVLRGQQALTVNQAREVSRRIGIPLHLLRLGDPGGDDPTKRRDFGKAMAFAFIPLPASRGADEATAPALTAITGAQRRLDATTPARELAGGVTAHVEMANRLLAHAGKTPFATQVAAAASEAAGFAAWLHTDMLDLGTARTYYRMALDRAHRARNDLLAGYMLGSLAAFEADSGDPEVGLACIQQARSLIGDTGHPTPRAWLDANEAVALATARRDPDRAREALEHASRAIDSASLPEAPPWPWVFAFDHPKLAGYRARAAVQLGRPAEALAAFAQSVAAIQPAPKQRAVIMLDVATAACQDSTTSHDTDGTDNAFRLACEAHAIGVAYGSERVIDRTRKLRRSYTGPATPHVRKLDDQLRTGLPR